MDEKMKKTVMEFCGERQELFSLFVGYMSGDAARGYPFAYAVAGGEQGFCAGMTHAYRDRTALKFLGGECCGKQMRLRYLSERDGLAFETDISSASGSFRQSTTVKNVGTQAKVLIMLVNQLRFGEYGEVFPADDHEVYYCKQTWYNEGQWKKRSMRELGIVDNGVAPPTPSFVIDGSSTMTTAEYFPNIYVHDVKNDVCYYCELEPVGKWMMALGLRRDWWTAGGEIVLTCGSAEDRTLQFVHALSPSQSYTTAPCVYGAVRGGVQEAVRLQNADRRLSHTRASKNPPVIFNDYLNCLWAQPIEEDCLRLAIAAKALGADAYATDAGWFGDKNTDWSVGLGVWRLDSNRFDGGALPFVKKIAAMGLTAGLWLEIECCNAAVAETLPRDWFVTYNGELFGNSARKFFDFRNKEVREYLFGKIKPLLDAGVRFIKNDYNDSYYGLGDEACYGLQENARAFLSFIDELYRMYPDLIIENCSSGAMRSDGGTMKHFALQSVSDQDDYRLYPSIVKGSLLNILPEQLGVWCMPRPAHMPPIDYNADPLDLIGFNFVSALVGVPYLSGRIDLCGEDERKLIADGIRLYRENVPFLTRCAPKFPLGVEKRDDWDALVLSDGDRELLYVWRLDGCESADVPLAGVKSVKQLFPSRAIDATVGQDKITVRSARKFCAAIFELNCDRAKTEADR